MSNYDYYETLELPRTCSQEEIAEAYRRLSLKYHPKNTSIGNEAISEYTFNKLAEAYEVLSDPNKKSIYDIYGKDGLYNVYIMDETHTILGVGAGAVSKLKQYGTHYLERIFNYKFPYEYNTGLEEMLRRKDSIPAFYKQYCEE